MNEKTKSWIIISVLFLCVTLIMILVINTIIKEEIHITYRYTEGREYSLLKDGPWFYLIPGIQAIIGLGVLYLAVGEIRALKRNSSE